MSETTKEKAIEVIRRLPEDVSFEDILHELEFFARIERGFREDAEGKLIPHEKVMDRMTRLLKSAGH